MLLTRPGGVSKSGEVTGFQSLNWKCPIQFKMRLISTPQTQYEHSKNVNVSAVLEDKTPTPRNATPPLKDIPFLSDQHTRFLDKFVTFSFVCQWKIQL